MWWLDRAQPGARHERHRHHNCDEFFIVIKGLGHIYSDLGEEPSVEGDVVYSPRALLARFNNTRTRTSCWPGLDGRRIDRRFRLRGDPTSHKP